MVQRLDYLKETPSQTAGPYVHIGLAPRAAGFEIFAHDFGPDPADAHAPGTHVVIEGTVIDGAGALVRDALIEVWQADAAGRFGPSEGFRGWGRVLTDFETGLFRFATVKPGRVPWVDGRPQAPHLTLWIVARGINTGLQTRMYFPDEAEANAADPVLGRIENRARVATLIAAGAGPYRFDIRLQGDGETVFFDI